MQDKAHALIKQEKPIANPWMSGVLSFVLVGSPFTVVAKTPRRPCQDQFAILLRSVVVALKPAAGTWTEGDAMRWRRRRWQDLIAVVLRSVVVAFEPRPGVDGRRRDDLDVVGVVDDDANDASKFNAVPGNLISKFVSRNLK